MKVRKFGNYGIAIVRGIVGFNAKILCTDNSFHSIKNATNPKEFPRNIKPNWFPSKTKAQEKLNKL